MWEASVFYVFNFWKKKLVAVTKKSPKNDANKANIHKMFIIICYTVR